ncbi:NfeD family protein [Erwinia amylovora]|uniref:Inner membrane protein ybbJ n=4 Tax=Erwinia amylovora TaxID=552 RepID=A0A830ZYN0_ERWAM|nr:NfeD family protein [Erwinia amylovora]CBX79888.1 Inner membrane protein ybbJ [Erwinia amylovora ATCC BAA-2158]CDK14599.1 Inner membrane protein ybbJ [Erwinia amylovora LA635]CDK17967.1 Inner membrane protein ybbJ [Erwinia amylovora LA636]CDK21336.1 Inner membrane protein ybbJ [Erwinia amylovora LA637]ATZ10933.1 NfeD family protein [Erwinia amylovora]
MLDPLLANPWWLWLTLGGLLLAAEMLGTSGYLLWSGIAAVLVSLLVWLVPLPWEWQGMSFAILTILSALWWYRWLKGRQQRHPPSTLNQRGKQLIGRQLTLDAALVNGFGHVRIGDGNWRVQADEDLPAGTRIIVVAVEGITLRVVARSI